MNGYSLFKYPSHNDYPSHWDQYALKYAKLLKPGTLYYLHKRVMYDIIEKFAFPDIGTKGLEILDVNCGTGNDFPYLLSKGNVTGIDGSQGMLNKAYEKHREQILSQNLTLYHGNLEEFNESSLENKSFDLIYSITGGFSYINDDELSRVLKVFKAMLKPGGYIITGHLNTFCLAESSIWLLRGKMKRILLRLKKQVKAKCGSTMYFRNKKMLDSIITSHFSHVEYFPLICISPPYQTGINTKPKTFEVLRRIENFMVKNKFGVSWADQIVVLCR